MAATHSGRDLVVAYDSLSEPLKKLAESLRGLHKFEPPVGVDATDEYREMQERRKLTTEHPIVRVHPETKREGSLCPPNQSELPQICRRHVAARERAGSRNLLGTRRAAGIHFPLQVGRERSRYVGQPLGRPLRTARYL